MAPQPSGFRVARILAKINVTTTTAIAPSSHFIRVCFQGMLEFCNLYISRIDLSFHFTNDRKF